ncbi:DUF3040 domain-containing protein [bacterium RCC_150]
MPLSDYERRRLEALEMNLAAEDPALARHLATGKVPGLWLRRCAGLILVLGGIALLILGIAAHLPALGVLGFLSMIGGACGFPWRRLTRSGKGHRGSTS